VCSEGTDSGKTPSDIIRKRGRKEMKREERREKNSFL
jgi:hypothetical protein